MSILKAIKSHMIYICVQNLTLILTNTESKIPTKNRGDRLKYVLHIFLQFTEIVENVRVYNSVKPFRPDVTVLTCEAYIKECMDECWNEDPDQRPDFKFIRYRLKSMLQGL